MLNLKLEILNLRLISGTKVKSKVLEVKKEIKELSNGL